jgi:hypothetical protein
MATLVEGSVGLGVAAVGTAACEVRREAERPEEATSEERAGAAVEAQQAQGEEAWAARAE